MRSYFLSVERKHTKPAFDLQVGDRYLKPYRTLAKARPRSAITTNKTPSQTKALQQSDLVAADQFRSGHLVPFQTPLPGTLPQARTPRAQARSPPALVHSVSTALAQR
eukprot:scaffold72715_cov51-Phaeocystis_antarctica.AAC.3